MARFILVAVAAASLSAVFAQDATTFPTVTDKPFAGCHPIYDKFAEEFPLPKDVDTLAEHKACQADVIKNAVIAHLFDKQSNGTEFGLNENCHDSIEEMKTYFANRIPERAENNTIIPTARQFVHPASAAFARQVSTNDDNTMLSWQKYDGVIVDWRPVMADIKNQKKCGSCYAFSSTSELETRLALSAGRVRAVPFSEQQIVDCSYGQFNLHGCQGGTAPGVYKYYRQSKAGFNSPNSYPYAALRQTCSMKSDAKPIEILAIGQLQKYSYYDPDVSIKAMEDALQGGPINIGIKVVDDFYVYKGGMYYGTACGSGVLGLDTDHAVSIVGYGSNYKDGDYWIIRNSWGCTWGEAGYMRVPKGKNICGVETDVSWAIVRGN